MAAKLHRDLSEDLESVTIFGTFKANAASNPDNTLNSGVGFTVVRTGVGVYRVTTKNPYNALGLPVWQVHLAALADRKPVGGVTITVNATKTLSFDVTIVAVATATELTANDFVSFALKVRRWSTKK